MENAPEIILRTLPGIPRVETGDDVARLICEALGAADLCLRAGDVLVIAHKIISKAEGRRVRLEEITPSAEARAIAEEVRKDPRKVEVILCESSEIIRTRPPLSKNEGVIIARHRLGHIMANAGVDESNTGERGTVLLLPEDPDASARTVADRLFEQTGTRVGVVVSDTFGRPWRRGQVNVAIGLSGVPGVVDLTGETDADGRELKASFPAVADELAATAGLLMGKADRSPVVLVRGLRWESGQTSALDLLRPADEDLFL